MVVMNVGRDDAFAGGPDGLGTGLRHALLPQPILGFLDIAVGRLERPLGIHHPGPRGIPQRLDLVSRNRHG